MTVQLALTNEEADQLAAVLADAVVDPAGDLLGGASGSHLNFDEADVAMQLRIWRKLRRAMRRLPYDWKETNGRVPRWARHR